MKAVVISEHGGTEQLIFQEVPDPILEPGMALVRVAAVALNHLDIWVRKGVPGHRFPLPLIPGTDISGVVEATAEDVINVAPGMRVAVSPGMGCGYCEMCLTGRQNLCLEYSILGENTHGGCAEYVAVPASNLIPLQEDITFTDAAAISVSFLTAYHMLITNAHLRAGENVLIHAAGSGTGTAAIQIAKLHGATIIATAGSDAKLEKAKALGADVLVNYKHDDFLSIARKATGGQGVDIVFDHIGPETLEKNMRCLRRGGRLVTCGSTTGGSGSLDLRRLFFRNLKVLGSTMGGMGELLEVWRLVEHGRLAPVVDTIFPWEQIADAHAYLESRKAFGKVVMEVFDGEDALKTMAEEEELPLRVSSLTSMQN